MVSADATGNAAKFTVSTVANGKVYVVTRCNNAGGYGSANISGELNVDALTPNLETWVVHPYGAKLEGFGEENQSERFRRVNARIGRNLLFILRGLVHL
jgi:hypothetical protein